MSAGDCAKKLACVPGGAAVGCAALGGVLGYVSYERTADLGPFRSQGRGRRRGRC